jgi:hypothetical protein
MGIFLNTEEKRKTLGLFLLFSHDFLFLPLANHPMPVLVAVGRSYISNRKRVSFANVDVDVNAMLTKEIEDWKGNTG